MSKIKPRLSTDETAELVEMIGGNQIAIYALGISRSRLYAYKRDGLPRDQAKILRNLAQAGKLPAPPPLNLSDKRKS